MSCEAFCLKNELRLTFTSQAREAGWTVETRPRRSKLRLSRIIIIFIAIIITHADGSHVSKVFIRVCVWFCLSAW